MNEKNYCSTDSKIITFFSGLIIGGIIGGIVGLLFAPKSGNEIREDLVKNYKELEEKSKKFVEDTNMKVDNLLKNTRTGIEENLDRLSKAINAGRKAATEARLKDRNED